MDPGSIFILLVVVLVAVGGSVFLFFTAAGLELREDLRARRRGRPRPQPRPEHLRVENPEHVISSPVQSAPATPTHEHGESPAGR